MPPRARTLIARLADGVGLALAVVGGMLLHHTYPLTFGRTVTLSLPFALPIILLAAVSLVVFAAARERRDAARRQAALLADLRDANEKLKAQAVEMARQRDESRLLESAVIHAHDAVVVLDAHPHPGSDRRILYVNDAFCRMTGYSPKEVLGQSLQFLQGTGSDPTTLSRIYQAIEAGQPVQTESQNQRKDGSAYWVEFNLVPVLEPGKRIAHWVMIQRDVTDRKRAEEALRKSEGRYRLLFDRNPHPMWVFDQDTLKYLAVNDAAVYVYGFSREEFLEMTVADLYDPADSSQSLVAPPSPSGEYDLPLPRRQRKKDGTLIDVEVSSFALTLDGRSAELVLAIDVTERFRAEAALRRSERLFRGIFEVTSAGVTLTDTTGRFTACNPAFARLIGRSIEETLGMTAADITHPDDWSIQVPLLEEARLGLRDRFDLRKRYLRPDGREIWTELSFAAIRGPDGRYESGLGVTVDVTDRKRLEDQMRQTQKMEAIGQMAGGVAHDFNNLLTAVLGNLAMVRVHEDDPNRPLLAAAEEATTRAADLTRKLLGYARRSQLAAGPVDPRQAFAVVIGTLQQSSGREIAIKVHIPPGCGSVLADSRLLHLALLNLCENAQDAMPRGGVLTLSAEPVALISRAHRAFIRLSVADTGVGMTEEVKARIFEPFFSTKEVGKGVGLGLPMVHGIVDQHHGWVECTSTLGTGTRIDLYLPEAATLTATETVTPSDPDPHPLTRPEPRDALDPRPPADDVILLVDDESMIRELARLILERAGYRVLTADDGMEAVEVFTRERVRIRLIIMDVTMPRMSGRDAYQLIAQQDPDIRVLFSTGYSSDDMTAVEGAVGLLNKPYRPNDLLAAVRDALAITPVADGPAT